jgi:hypothetical protein
MRMTLVLVGGLFTLACSTTNSGNVSGPQQACMDTADAVAKAAQRCGQDYQQNYDAFVRTAANGDCANIVQVRDEGALRGTCIPSLSTVACPDLLSANIDATCKGQLLRKSSWEPTLFADEPPRSPALPVSRFMMGDHQR